MKITVNRFKSTDEATLSTVAIDGEIACFGLEDEYREVKVMDETRIPAGEYRVQLRDEGGMTKRYRAKYPSFHEGMLHVLGVPGFEWIYIHVGNREDQTSGCLLIGDMADINAMAVQKSAIAYTKFYQKVVAAARAGSLRIEYIDGDR